MVFAWKLLVDARQGRQMSRMHAPNLIARAALFGASKLERAASLLRGKGFGSYSVKQEATLALRALGRTPKLVVDVGGNRGDYTAAIQRLVPDCEIVVFEPSAINVAALQDRFADTPSISIEPYGLSDRQHDATLFTDQPGSGLASLSRRNLTHFGIALDHEETISLIALEDYWSQRLAGRPIDIMKLDVEGHELHALRGAGKALAATSVVQFEFGGCNIDSRTYFQDFFYLFEDAGFDVLRITPIGLETIERYTEDTEVFRTTNFLAVRRASKFS